MPIFSAVVLTRHWSSLPSFLHILSKSQTFCFISAFLTFLLRFVEPRESVTYTIVLFPKSLYSSLCPLVFEGSSLFPIVPPLSSTLKLFLKDFCYWCANNKFLHSMSVCPSGPSFYCFFCWGWCLKCIHFLKWYFDWIQSSYSQSVSQSLPQSLVSKTTFRIFLLS